jgi:hypothetical protein
MVQILLFENLYRWRLSMGYGERVLVSTCLAPLCRCWARQAAEDVHTPDMSRLRHGQSGG